MINNNINKHVNIIVLLIQSTNTFTHTQNGYFTTLYNNTKWNNIQDKYAIHFVSINFYTHWLAGLSIRVIPGTFTHFNGDWYLLISKSVA
jgi:hypothetical protein